MSKEIFIKEFVKLLNNSCEFTNKDKGRRRTIKGYEFVGKEVLVLIEERSKQYYIYFVLLHGGAFISFEKALPYMPLKVRRFMLYNLDMFL